ncbi:unnamed protein product, partial [Ectocarpus sp. 4 AP-2014]
MNVRWGYNWGSDPPATIDDAHFEFVPMIWRANAANVQASHIDKILAYQDQYNVEYVLGFNEPELPTQSNMTVQQALDTWDVMTDGFAGSGIKLVSPSVSGAGARALDDWLYPFMDEVELRNADADPENDLQVDAIAYHYYTVGFNANTEANKILTAIDNIWDKYQKPIWLTEFAGVNFNGVADVAQKVQFNADLLEILIPAFEERPYLERYAWWQFGSGGQPYSPLSSNVNGVYTPTLIGDVYGGTLHSGESLDLSSGERESTDVQYLRGGSINNTEAGAEITGTGSTRAGLGSTISLGDSADAARSSIRQTLVLAGGRVRTNGIAAGSHTISGTTTLDSTTIFSVASDLTITGAIVAGGIESTGIVKTDTGTMYVSGNNTYSGLTAIQSGKLTAVSQVGSATGTGPVEVGSSGTLGGLGYIAGYVTVQSGGTLAPGVSHSNLGIASVPAVNAGAVVKAIAFDFNGVQDDAPLTATSTLNPALELVSGFDFGSGMFPRNAVNEGNEFNVAGFSTNDNYSDAFNKEDYMTFTVAPVEGLAMVLKDVTYELRRNGSGAAKKYRVLTSIDGYTYD